MIKRIGAFLLIIALNNSAPAALSIVNNEMSYAGSMLDAESGLIYLNARYDDPAAMRFISRDSYRLLNRYIYADGNPVSNVDPSGHSAQLAAGVTGGFFTAFLTGYFGLQYYLEKRELNALWQASQNELKIASEVNEGIIKKYLHSYSYFYYRNDARIKIVMPERINTYKTWMASPESLGEDIVKVRQEAKQTRSLDQFLNQAEQSGKGNCYEQALSVARALNNKGLDARVYESKEIDHVVAVLFKDGKAAYIVDPWASRLTFIENKRKVYGSHIYRRMELEKGFNDVRPLLYSPILY